MLNHEDNRVDRRVVLESSALYYRIINEEVKARLGGLHSAKCILYMGVDFEEIEIYQRNGEWKQKRSGSGSPQLKGLDVDFYPALHQHNV